MKAYIQIKSLIRRTAPLLLGGLLAFAPAMQAAAASININFCIGQTDASQVDAGETATQFQSVDGTNWNHVLLANKARTAPTNFITASTGGNFIRLSDASGNTNAAQLTSTLSAGSGFCNFSYATPEPQLSSSGEAALMNSYLLIASPSETFTVSGLGSAFTNNGYKVYLFFDIGTNVTSARSLGYSVDDGVSSNIFWTLDQIGDQSDTNDDGVMEWLQATGTTSGTAVTNANYALFEGLSGSSFTVSLPQTLTSARGSISGMQIVANTGAAPVITSFTAVPGTITNGGTATLAWQVSGADSVVISGIGTVAASGTTNVNPAVSTTYTLTASNAFSTVTANATVNVSVNKGSVDVYLLGGQSNMQGKGNVTSIPEGQETITGVLYYYGPGCTGTATSPDTLYTNVTPTGSGSGLFGPEIGFANRIKELRPGVPMALIKYAASGTSLIWDWRPGADAADTANWGAKFSGFINTMNGGLAALRAAGYEPRIVGMLWQQGEQDAKNGWDYTDTPATPIANQTNAGPLYESNLVHFISRVREQFSADIAPEGLRFVQGTVLPYAPAGGDVVTRFLARETVNAAKFNVDENSGLPVAVSNTSTIACDEIITPTRAQTLPATGDEVHLAAEGQLMLGKLMAEHMQAPSFSSWSSGLTNNAAGDDDGDGLSNGLEFFLGTDPTAPDSRSAGPVGSPALLDAGSGLTHYFVMSFRRSMTNNAAGFSWQVDGSTNLTSWSASAFTPVLVDRTNHTDGTATFRYRTARPVDADSQSFLRLRLLFSNP